MRSLPSLLLLLALLASSVLARPISVVVSGGSMMDGDHFADVTVAPLRGHFAGSRRIALVLHATHPDDRDRMEARLRKAFAHLVGAEAESLHRHDAAGRMRLLAEADGIFVGGGETFVLLGELHRTGELGLIRERVLAGVPYLGSSAGANVAGLLIGTTNDFPVAEIPTRAALGVFPAVINPHHPRAGEAEHAGRVGKIAGYLRFNPDHRVLGLANASMARLHAGEVRVVAGEAWLHTAGGVRALRTGDQVPELAPKS
jgi:dipeptidase E